MINTMKNDTAIIAFLIALVIGLLIVLITQPLPTQAAIIDACRNSTDKNCTPIPPPTVTFMTADQYRAMYAPAIAPTTTVATTTTAVPTIAELIAEIKVLEALLKATQGK